MGRLLVVVMLVTTWAGVARADAPSSADLELAKAHFHTGQIYYQNNRFPDAAREFEEAYRLSKKADLLFNMGKAYDGVGDHARAMAAYRRFVAEVPESVDRSTVEARIAGLQRLVGRIKITSPVAGAAVLLDGAAMGQTPLADPFEVNPGAHRIEVSREGYRTFRKSVVAAPGGEAIVDAALESLVKVQVVEVERKEKAVPVYKRWWLWTAVGVVVAGAAVTAGVLGSQTPPVSGDFAQLPAVR